MQYACWSIINNSYIDFNYIWHSWPILLFCGFAIILIPGLRAAYDPFKYGYYLCNNQRQAKRRLAITPKIGPTRNRKKQFN